MRTQTATSFTSLFLLGALAGTAQTLSCTFFFIGSGAVGLQSFTNTEIVVRTVGYANAVSSSGSGFTTLTNNSASIFVSGVGSYRLSAPTTIVVQDVSSTNQDFYLSAFGQLLIAYEAPPTSPLWNLASGYTDEMAAFHLPPANGWLANWSVVPMLTDEGYTVDLHDTAGEMPVLFQAALNVGLRCSGSSTGSIADVQAVIDQALDVTPASADKNGDGVVNVVDVEIVINAVFGCA